MALSLQAARAKEARVIEAWIAFCEQDSERANKLLRVVHSYRADYSLTFLRPFQTEAQQVRHTLKVLFRECCHG